MIFYPRPDPQPIALRNSGEQEPLSNWEWFGLYAFGYMILAGFIFALTPAHPELSNIRIRSGYRNGSAPIPAMRPTSAPELLLLLAFWTGIFLIIYHKLSHHVQKAFVKIRPYAHRNKFYKRHHTEADSFAQKED